jgi:hypothetical protein
MVKTKYCKFKFDIFGKHKSFDKKLYEKYDIPARNKIKEILGDYVLDNPNIYEQDMIINSETCKYKYLEIQVCSKWITPTFPKKYPYIYERKKRYGKNTLFITFNKWLTRAHLFDIHTLVNEKPTRIKKYSRIFVYEIPWNRISTVKMIDFDKEVVESY